MGHKSDDTFMSYISRVSGVDVQSIMNGRTPDQETIDFLRSMRTQIDFDAPRPPQSSLTDLRYWRGDQILGSLAEEKEVYAESLKDIFAGSEMTAPFSGAVDRPPPSRHLLHYLQFDKHRATYIDLSARKTSDEGPSLPTMMLPLVGMSATGRKQWYYPGCEPDSSGQCVRCKRMDQR